jgi:hypothetical protein
MMIARRLNAVVNEWLPQSQERDVRVDPLCFSPHSRGRSQASLRATDRNLVSEELKRKRWQEADLKTRPKGDSVKVVLAARWRAETTITVGWIAELLAMGTRGSLNPLLYCRRKLGREYQILRTDTFTKI